MYIEKVAEVGLPATPDTAELMNVALRTQSRAKASGKSRGVKKRQPSMRKQKCHGVKVHPRMQKKNPRKPRKTIAKTKG